MRESRTIMGMQVVLTIPGEVATPADFEAVFAHFVAVDDRFSPFKPDSEISRINRGEIATQDYSAQMTEIFALSEKTKLESAGFFNICRPDGLIDPCGIVKGWAIHKAACLLRERDIENFCVEAGGDVQCHGVNAAGEEWRVGIRSPFNSGKLIKMLHPKGCGVATSGSYIQGPHIYDPLTGRNVDSDIVSLTVVGPDVMEADRYATAAFAMGRGGIAFIANLDGFEGYEVDRTGISRMTSGLVRHLPC